LHPLPPARHPHRRHRVAARRPRLQLPPATQPATRLSHPPPQTNQKREPDRLLGLIARARGVTMLNSTETVEAEAERLLIIAQQPRRRGRPQRAHSQLLQRALALCKPYLPASLFDLLCALTHKRLANLDEPQRTEKQREIFESDLKSHALLSL